MSPTVFRKGPWRFYFFSREEPRIHVHVGHPDGEAKFWLVPSIELAVNFGITNQQISEAKKIIEEHYEDILKSWHRHFGTGNS